MGTITASAVQALRKRTGLPMMDCKNALAEAGGDEGKAIDLLRQRGEKVAATRVDRETAFGRIGIYHDDNVGAMVELKCESAPVTKNEEFIQLAQDLAQQLATGPGAATPDELLDQPSPSQPGMTLRQQKDDLFNRIREVFNIGRIVRIDGRCAGYSHNATTVAGVIVHLDGGDEGAGRDVCMHVVSMRPQSLTTAELDPQVVAKERQILTAAAREEGKPEEIIEKMVEGRMRGFYAETVLLEQPFVKEPKLSVAEFAKQNGMTIHKFVHWELGAQ